ncbi:MAG: hypothetical protein ACXACY_17205 [Candidatus Hodarchaeales archaeon]|jgi:hypothetical protein
MKYLVIDEMSKEDFTRIMAADATQIHGTEREKGKLPPHVFPDHFLHSDLPQLTQSVRFFKIYDTDDPTQLSNVDALWTTFNAKTWKRWLIPITEIGPFTSAYNEYKKKVK